MRIVLNIPTERVRATLLNLDQRHKRHVSRHFADHGPIITFYYA